MSAHPRARSLAAIGLALAAIGGAFASQAMGAATSAQIISKLNAERVANGIPGGITENADWTKGCKSHVAYMYNNNEVTAVEDPANKWYTQLGAGVAPYSVLFHSSAPAVLSWSAPGIPFANAPSRLMQLMWPGLTSVGANETGNFSCVTTVPGYGRTPPATDTLYGYPGAGTTVHFAEIAREGPRVPGFAVGLKQGTETGPYLMAFWAGPSGDGLPPLNQLSAATLKGPDGPVEVKVVNHATDALAFNGGGYVIPPKALKPASSYRLDVTFSDDQSTRSFSGGWDFKTAAVPKSSDLLTLGTPKKFKGGATAVPMTPRWPLVDIQDKIKVTVSLKTSKKSKKPTDRLRDTLTKLVPITSLPTPPKGKHWYVTVSVPKFTYGGVSFAAFTKSVTVSG